MSHLLIELPRRLCIDSVSTFPSARVWLNSVPDSWRCRISIRLACLFSTWIVSAAAAAATALVSGREDSGATVTEPGSHCVAQGSNWTLFPQDLELTCQRNHVVYCYVTAACIAAVLHTYRRLDCCQLERLCLKDTHQRRWTER